MASSKTLTPTNVTISIPAMTDAPDASVFANTASATVDAVNALNNKAIVTETVTLTTSSGGWVYFPAGRRVLTAFAENELMLFVSYEAANNRYRARNYCEVTSATSSIAPLPGNTTYSVTYSYQLM